MTTTLQNIFLLSHKNLESYIGRSSAVLLNKLEVGMICIILFNKFNMVSKKTESKMKYNLIK